MFNYLNIDYELKLQALKITNLYVSIFESLTFLVKSRNYIIMIHTFLVNIYSKLELKKSSLDS